MSITNPFQAAEDTFNPGAHVESYADNTAEAMEQLNMGNAGVTTNTNLVDLAKILSGSDMSSTDGGVTDFSSLGLSPNPYAGESGPVAGRQAVDYGSMPVLNPANNTYRAPSPTAPSGIGVTGGSSFDYFGNNVSQYNPFSSTYTSSPQEQRGMFSSSEEGRTDLGFGMSFNADAISNNFNPSYAGAWKSTGDRLFDFGDVSIADGLDAGGLLGASKYAAGKLGQFSKATGNYDLYGKASELNSINNLFGMTGNRAYDMATKGTVLEYLNDPLTPRSMLGAAVNKAGFGYGGLTMTGLDYLQGYNPDTGNLYRSGAYALNPMAGGLGDLFNVWGDVGQKAGTFDEGFDPTKAQTLEELNAGYYSRFNENFGTFEADKEVADYLSQSGLQPGTHQYDQAVKSYNMAMDEKNPYGQGFRDSMAETRAKAEATAAMDRQIEENRRQEALIEQARAELAAEEARAAEAQRQAEAQRAAEAQAQAQAQQERAAMEASNSFSSSDSGSFDEGGNYSDWGSQESFEDDQGGSDWDTSHSDFSWDDSSSDSGGGDSGGGGGGSYIATAATQALGEEGLTIFEGWRDYMMDVLPTFKSTYGRYRVTAPKIVAAIDKKKNSKGIYNYIWDMHLKPIFDLIQEDKDSDKALKDYKIMVRELQNKFLKEKV